MQVVKSEHFAQLVSVSGHKEQDDSLRKYPSAQFVHIVSVLSSQKLQVSESDTKHFP